MNHRHRSHTTKVYLPSNARYNQYLLAEFKITDELINRFAQGKPSDKLKPWQEFYQNLSELFFAQCENAGIENVHFVANNKLPRVRFSEELRCWQTEQQMLVFYNPAYHQSFKRHFDGKQRAQKVSLLFLASGENIRSNAAKYHQQVRDMLNTFLAEAGIDAANVRLRDHQHLTYNLFAKHKGVEGSHGHTLRLIKNRYAASDVALPEPHNTISYVVASMPITRKLIKKAAVNEQSEQAYGPLYQMISDACLEAAKSHKLLNGAFIADGSTPIIRNSDTKAEQQAGELIMLGYDPKTPKDKFIVRSQDDKLVDYAQIIFAATQANIEKNCYGKFVETVEKSLRTMAKSLDLQPERDEIALRFHQHLAYHVPSE